MTMRVIEKAQFHDALELCDQIQRMSKLVGDPIAYVESTDGGTFNTVTLVEIPLSDGSTVHNFILAEEEHDSLT